MSVGVTPNSAQSLVALIAVTYDIEVTAHVMSGWVVHGRCHSHQESTVHSPNPISVVFLTSIKDGLATVSDSVSVDKPMNGTMVHNYCCLC